MPSQKKKTPTEFLMLNIKSTQYTKESEIYSQKKIYLGFI